MNNTTQITFRKATKTEAKLRLAVIGPSGAGKTYSALAIASKIGTKIAVIDTERGSAAKYADQFEFDTVELTDCNPANYVHALRAAAAAGYDVCIIDSLSHAWNGRGGALEMVDEVARRSKTGNSFGAWRDVTPLHTALMDEIVGSKMHVIATMRSKTEWSQEKDDRGRTVIRKVGTAPIQRDGVEYEFDVVLDLDTDHVAVVSKTRCPALTGKTVDKPGAQVAKVLLEWLHGAPVETKPIKAAPVSSQETTAAVQPAEPTGDILEAMALAKDLAQLDAIAKQAGALDETTKKQARKIYASRRKAIEQRKTNEDWVKDACKDERLREDLVYELDGDVSTWQPETATDLELQHAVDWLKAQNPVT